MKEDLECLPYVEYLKTSNVEDTDEITSRQFSAQALVNDFDKPVKVLLEDTLAETTDSVGNLRNCLSFGDEFVSDFHTRMTDVFKEIGGVHTEQIRDFVCICKYITSH